MTKHKAKLGTKAAVILKKHGYTPAIGENVLLSLYRITDSKLNFIDWIGTKRKEFLKVIPSTSDDRAFPSPVVKQHFDFWLLNNFED